MKDPVTVFRQYCKRRALRYTPERDVIIKEIYRKDGHFDIDGLFLRIRKNHPRIKLAKGSIYRTVPHLIEAGLIRESFTESGRASYEQTLGHVHHDHMKCVSCGKVFEFYDKRIDGAQRDMCRRHNFKMLKHTHVIEGYCRACRKRGD